MLGIYGKYWSGCEGPVRRRVRERPWPRPMHAFGGAGEKIERLPREESSES